MNLHVALLGAAAACAVTWLERWRTVFVIRVVTRKLNGLADAQRWTDAVGGQLPGNDRASLINRRQCLIARNSRDGRPLAYVVDGRVLRVDSVDHALDRLVAPHD